MTNGAKAFLINLLIIAIGFIYFLWFAWFTAPVVASMLTSYDGYSYVCGAYGVMIAVCVIALMAAVVDSVRPRNRINGSKVMTASLLLLLAGSIGGGAIVANVYMLRRENTKDIGRSTLYYDCGSSGYSSVYCNRFRQPVFRQSSTFYGCGVDKYGDRVFVGYSDYSRENEYCPPFNVQVYDSNHRLMDVYRTSSVYYDDEGYGKEERAKKRAIRNVLDEEVILDWRDRW